MPMLSHVLYCISSRDPVTTDDTSVLGGLGMDQGEQKRRSAAAATAGSGVAWRDLRAMQVRSGLGGRAAWDLGAANVDR